MYKKMRAVKRNQLDIATISIDTSNKKVVLSGEWTWVTINEDFVAQLDMLNGGSYIVDGNLITKVDTAGIYFVHKICNMLKSKNIIISSIELGHQAKKLFDLTADIKSLNDDDLSSYEKLSSLESFNKKVSEAWHAAMQLLSFFGQLCYTIATMFKREYSLYTQGVIDTISSAGIKGVFISSSLCFLIGVNLTYQMAPQFVTYGANVYVVNFLGISLLREVTPLLTAIIIAGRTGSAITASIGTMQVQEEIDALKTMGISPIRRLVLPRVIGLVISLPILTMFADVASMVGGMIFAGPLLSVNPDLFLSRLQNYVSINNFWIGIFKSVFFAWIIAMVGCHRGFKVKSNAESIGVETTRSVVTSICLIIFIDAMFAILFKVLGVK